MWRNWAALALAAAGDVVGARRTAAEALRYAREWGRPRALGAALHAMAVAQGAVKDGSDGWGRGDAEPGPDARLSGAAETDARAALALFEEAEQVLTAASGRLELAHTLTDHGVALCGLGLFADAEAKLRQAGELAELCGAAPLADRVDRELRALEKAASAHVPGAEHAVAASAPTTQPTELPELEFAQDAPPAARPESAPAPETMLPTSASDVAEADRPPLRISCFGGFRLWRGDTEVDCSAVRPKARSLLQLLAVHAARPIHREQLLEALWPDLGPQAGVRNLQVTVSQLRAFLEPETGRGSRQLLLRDGESYQISLLPQDVCDVREFEQAVRTWRRLRAGGAPEQVADALREAQRWYTGDLLPEVGPAEWAVSERRRLRVLASDVVGAFAEAELVLGRAQAALEAAERSIELDEYRDASWRVLIAAHQETGNVAAADQARRRYERILQDLVD
jgi:DNA-binding SARP family transcriptional activator